MGPKCTKTRPLKKVGGGLRFLMSLMRLMSLMSLAIAKVLGYPVTVSIPGLLLAFAAFAASALSGIAAGIYPSLKATQIYPVDIIRS